MPTHKLYTLDKSHYAFILLTIKAIIIPLNLSFKLDKNLKHLNKPENLFELNITPQKFLFNRFIPSLLSFPCTYHLRTILKDNFKIINSLTWANQNRIKNWTNNIRDIKWPCTLKYISFEEKPLSLQTNINFSNLKNFKVKLLADELPNHLTTTLSKSFKI